MDGQDGNVLAIIVVGCGGLMVGELEGDGGAGVEWFARSREKDGDDEDTKMGRRKCQGLGVPNARDER